MDDIVAIEREAQHQNREVEGVHLDTDEQSPLDVLLAELNLNWEIPDIENLDISDSELDEAEI